MQEKQLLFYFLLLLLLTFYVGMYMYRLLINNGITFRATFWKFTDKVSKTNSIFRFRTLANIVVSK